MNLDEAVQHLARADIMAWSYPDTKWPLRGGSRLAPIALEKGYRAVEDLFRIEREQYLWLVTIFMPGPHIIHASQELQEAVYALENLYKLTQQQRDKYEEITDELLNLQHKGFVASVASTLDRPSILAINTEQDKVEDRFEFMLQHYLSGQDEETEAYRIYPYQEGWAIDSPDPDDPAPLTLAPSIKEATEFLIDLCSGS